MLPETRTIAALAEATAMAVHAVSAAAKVILRMDRSPPY
jgi:hypothetical protein